MSPNTENSNYLERMELYVFSTCRTKLPPTLMPLHHRLSTGETKKEDVDAFRPINTHGMGIEQTAEDGKGYDCLDGDLSGNPNASTVDAVISVSVNHFGNRDFPDRCISLEECSRLVA